MYYIESRLIHGAYQKCRPLKWHWTLGSGSEIVMQHEHNHEYHHAMKKIRGPNKFYKQLEKEAKRQDVTLEELEGLLIGLFFKDMKP